MARPVLHTVSPNTDTDMVSLVVEPKVSVFERWKTDFAVSVVDLLSLNVSAISVPVPVLSDLLIQSTIQ